MVVVLLKHVSIIKLEFPSQSNGISKVWVFQPTVVFKLVLHPALAWFFAAKIAGLAPLTVAVITLMAAMPSGVNVFVLAQQYGTYVQRAASAVLVSTVLAVISLSFLISWL